jgi:hypothetical protein
MNYQAITTKNGSYIRFIHSGCSFQFQPFSFHILTHPHKKKKKKTFLLSLPIYNVNVYVHIDYIYIHIYIKKNIYAPNSVFLFLSLQPFMAGLHGLRPNSSSSSFPSSSSSSSSSSFSQSITSRLLFLLTLLSFTLACFAFILQWRGGLNDPITRWSPDHHEFPGMAVSGSGPSHSSRSDCVDLLGQSRSPAFPYFRDWKFEFGSDLKPKV